jgi:hypothetical protein
LVDKLNNLYTTLSGGQSGEYVDIKTLWRWIKHIIHQIQNKKDLAMEHESEHRRYCDSLMREYNLKDFRELQMFINRLLEKNAKNQKRVEKIKKLLLVGKLFKFNNSYLMIIEPALTKVIPGQDFY